MRTVYETVRISKSANYWTMNYVNYMFQTWSRGVLHMTPINLCIFVPISDTFQADIK